MKKTSESGKFPTFKQPIQKRISAMDDPLIYSKQEFGQDLSNDQGSMTKLSNTQNQVAKRIQNRIRMRRATGSEKKILKQGIQRTNTCDKFIEPSDELVEINEQFDVKLEHLWQNSEEIGQLVNSYGGYIDPLEMKSKLQGESGILQCQIMGQNMEQVLLIRIKKIGELMKSQKICQQRADQVQRMIQQRMKRLGDILKAPR